MICGRCEAGRERRRERTERLKKRSDIPLRMAGYSLDSFERLNLNDHQQQALAICRLYAEHGYLSMEDESRPFGRLYGLYLFGPVGTGKTGLAVSVANVAMESGISVMYRTVPDLFDYIRNTFKPDSTFSYDDVFSRVRDVDLLVLDDLGTESPTAWAMEKLFQLIDHRYRNGMRLIVTSNYSPVELMQRFDEKDDQTGKRMVDRMMEMCSAVGVSGTSLRL